MANKVDSELIMSNDTTIDELKKMDPVKRTSIILEIKVIESLTPEEEGITLNEGYEYNISGAIPQLADALAKLAIEIDKDESMGENGGGAFLMLISQYYTQLTTKQ